MSIQIQNAGYIEAGANKGAANVLRQELSTLSSRFGDKDELAGKNAADAQKIQFLEGEKVRLGKELKKWKDKEEELQKDIEKMQKGEDYRKTAYDPVKFYVPLFFLVMLSIYIFQFYVSAVHAALFQNTADVVNKLGTDNNSLSVLMNSIFNPDVYSDAGNAIWFLILAPFFFYALGYVFHIFMEEEGDSKYYKLGGVIVPTFGLDTAIAYKIHSNVESTFKLIGQEVSIWYEDINFYIVLLMGFGAYIIWSILLHAIFNELNKRNPLKLLEQIQKMVAEIEQKIEDVQTKINQIKAGLPAVITAYFGGWMRFLNGMPQKDENLIKECNEIIKTFETTIVNVQK